MIILIIILALIIIFYLNKVKYENYFNNDKFLLLSPTGGLTHMLNRLNGVINISKKDNRKLIFNTENLTSFRMPFTDIFRFKDINIFSIDDLKDNIGNYSKEDIRNKRYKYKKNNYFINKVIKNDNDTEFMLDNEYLLITKGKYSDNFDNIFNHVRINKEIKDTIVSKKINIPYIGVHFRNTDIKNNINNFFKEIHDNLLQNKHINTIYIATDDYYAIDKFKNKFKDYKITNYSNIPHADKNIHYIDNRNLEKYDITKKQQIIDVLTDIYLLYKSNIFIKSKNSGLSNFVDKLKKSDVNNNIFSD